MAFDPTTIAYYAVICGALSALAPSLRTHIRRIVLGAAVGVLAATVFPSIRGTIGV
ncbi:MAG: hypothetical protein AAGH60_15390 [Pseudomonadota bacterium]